MSKVLLAHLKFQESGFYGLSKKQTWHERSFCILNACKTGLYFCLPGTKLSQEFLNMYI